MLDQYYWGYVSRISPEAPVPIVEVNSESTRLGGAANVANNISGLGAEALLIGVIGTDQNGALVTSLMETGGFSTAGLFTDPSRPTTTKTRVIAHNQHVVRFDRESTEEISPVLQDQILTLLHESIDEIDGIILQDYNKGVLTHKLIHDITRLAREHDTLVTVDPKFKNFFEYRGVTVFKPNRRELEQVFGVRLESDRHFEEFGVQLQRRLNAENILITRGERGMTVIESGGAVYHIPTRTRSVADVSGAGDTVIATLTLALAAGANMHEASAIANFAAGIVCEEVGIVPIDSKRLVDALRVFRQHESSVLGKESAHYGTGSISP